MRKYAWTQPFFRKKNLLRTHASRKDTIPRIPHLRTTSDVKMNKGILLSFQRVIHEACSLQLLELVGGCLHTFNPEIALSQIRSLYYDPIVCVP